MVPQLLIRPAVAMTTGSGHLSGGSAVGAPSHRVRARTARLKRLSRNAIVSYCLGILFYLYVSAHFHSVIFGVDAVPARVVILIGFVALLIELVFFERTPALVYFIFLMLLSGYLASAIYYARGLPGDVALILANAGMLFILLRRRLFVSIVYLIFLGFAGYFILNAVSGYTSYEGIAGPNGVSWVMIEAVVLLYIALDKEQKRISLLPAIITLAICIWAGGRSGIVSSGLLVLGLALFHFRQNRLVIAVSVLVPACLLASGIFDSLFELFDSYFSYFQTLGFSAHDRDQLINYYWRQLDATSLILGQDLTRDGFWQMWGLNPHNSYLSMHSWLGFAAFILLGLILGAIVRSLFSAKKIYGLLLFVLLLRAATEPLLFLSTFDFVVYYLTVRIYSEPAQAIDRMWSAIA